MNRRLLLIAAPALLLAAQARAQEEPIRLRDLYNKDMSFSDLALAHKGERVAVAGFMAPPLKAEATFLVLTKLRMAVCLFCDPTCAAEGRGWREGRTLFQDRVAAREQRVFGPARNDPM